MPTHLPDKGRNMNVLYLRQNPKTPLPLPGTGREVESKTDPLSSLIQPQPLPQKQKIKGSNLNRFAALCDEKPLAVLLSFPPIQFPLFLSSPSFSGRIPPTDLLSSLERKKKHKQKTYIQVCSLSSSTFSHTKYIEAHALFFPRLLVLEMVISMYWFFFFRVCFGRERGRDGEEAAEQGEESECLWQAKAFARHQPRQRWKQQRQPQRGHRAAP